MKVDCVVSFCQYVFTFLTQIRNARRGDEADAVKGVISAAWFRTRFAREIGWPTQTHLSALTHSLSLSLPLSFTHTRARAHTDTHTHRYVQCAPGIREHILFHHKQVRPNAVLRGMHQILDVSFSFFQMYREHYFSLIQKMKRFDVLVMLAAIHTDSTWIPCGL